MNEHKKIEYLYRLNDDLKFYSVYADGLCLASGLDKFQARTFCNLLNQYEDSMKRVGDAIHAVYVSYVKS